MSLHYNKNKVLRKSTFVLEKEMRLHKRTVCSGRNVLYNYEYISFGVTRKLRVYIKVTSSFP